MATRSTTAVVVVTAAEGAFAELGAHLSSLDVNVRQTPLLDFVAPEAWGVVDRALADLSRYRLLVATSPRGARALVARWQAMGHALPPESALQVWASGATTATALGRFGARARIPAPELIRRLGASAAIARGILDAAAPDDAVLYACGADRRDELPTMLRNAGMTVDEIVCYRTVLADESTARDAVNGADVVIVTSPSVASLLARSCAPGWRPAMLAVGPTTAERARMAGWEPAAVADRPDVDALADGVRALLSTR